MSPKPTKKYIRHNAPPIVIIFRYFNILKRLIAIEDVEIIRQALKKQINNEL